MNIPSQLIGQTAGIVALLNAVPYVLSILKGETKPSRSAYTIWLVIDIVTVSSYVASGARTTVWAFFGFALTTVVIFCLSLKYGMGGLRKLDIVCMAIAAVAITAWVVTDNPVTALYASILAKLIGYIPIYKKIYSHPDTENNLAWNMAAAASVLNVLALTTLRPEISIAPISISIVDVSLAYLLMFPTLRLKSKS